MPGKTSPLPLTHLTRQEVADLEDYPEWASKPQVHGDCSEDARPCPFVSCPHHLYLEVNPVTGSIKYNFPGLEVWELAWSCSLDVADEGGHSLEEVGERLNLTRERTRQLEVRAIIKVREAVERGDFDVGSGRLPEQGD